MKSSFIVSAASIAMTGGISSVQANDIDRTVLPIPEAPFSGKVGNTYHDSKSNFSQPITAPENAPNVLLILLDDIGFAHPSVNGGLAPMPNLDELAEEGVLYNKMHTTGLCSPTRASLLSGRSQHQMGFGTIVEMSTGYPGYDTIWPRESASIAEILKQNGYSTSAWGKWHNTPDWLTTSNGPFDKWPTGLGFEYFYGFMGGETSQYEPQLFENTTPIERGIMYEPDYHLTSDLSKNAISWLNKQHSFSPDKPYFMYFATGAGHSPMHVPKEWIEKFEGEFDEGWDHYREVVFEKQKKMGIIPKDTKLTPRPDAIPSWDEQTDEAKRVYARQMEIYAAFLAHTDHHVGKLVEHARSMPGGENTLVMYITGDNGASPEGSMTGTVNNMMTQNGIPATIEQQVEHLDTLGGPLHENHYGVPWSWAGSTPYKWMKRVASHLGAVRNTMVVSWPKGVDESQYGQIRQQFHSVADVAPTIYEAVGVPHPTEVNGVTQSEISGISMVYSFNDGDAKDQRTTQYFEAEGSRSIYHDGWMASAFHQLPWKLRSATGDFENDKWELYNLNEDYSQHDDIADKYPEKLAELKKVFDEQAQLHNVYPLDDQWVQRAINPERPSLTKGKFSYQYAGDMTRIPEGSAPNAFQRSHVIEALVDIPEDGAQGVITAQGGASGGYSLFILDGYLHYAYNFYNLEHYVVKSNIKVPSGNAIKVKMEYTQKPFRPFVDTVGGTAKLYINDKVVGEGSIDQQVFARFSITETLDISTDTGSSVSPLYRPYEPFVFTGEVDFVTFDLSETRPVITE